MLAYGTPVIFPKLNRYTQPPGDQRLRSLRVVSVPYHILPCIQLQTKLASFKGVSRTDWTHRIQQKA